MITCIDRNKYLQLVGLLTIAKNLTGQLKDVETSLYSLFEVEDSDENISGRGSPFHIGDAIYSEYTPKILLYKLGIKKC